jgi:hypothetical protein
MRELNLHNREKNLNVIVREVKKQKHITSFIPHKGHTCYELNLKEGTIQPAVISETTADIKGGTHKKVIIKEGCLYTSALNITNAQKKFFKHLRSSTYNFLRPAQELRINCALHTKKAL